MVIYTHSDIEFEYSIDIYDVDIMYMTWYCVVW